MVVVDNNTFEVYSNLSKADTGRIVGVDRTTIARWKARSVSNREIYNGYTIYFKETVIKQNKGYRRIVYVKK